jgi:hypothetical protein
MVEQNQRTCSSPRTGDWSSETEYRFLLRGNTEDEEFIDVRGALEAVVVGPLFHPAYRPGLYKLCDELGIEALEIKWQMGPPASSACVTPMTGG